MIFRRSLLVPDSGGGFLAIVEKWSVIQKRRVYMEQGHGSGMVLPAQKGALESVLAAAGFGPMAWERLCEYPAGKTDSTYGPCMELQ